MDAPLLARLCLALTYADEATAQVQAVGLPVQAAIAKPPVRSPRVAVMNRQLENQKLRRASATKHQMPVHREPRCARRRPEAAQRLRPRSMAPRDPSMG